MRRMQRQPRRLASRLQHRTGPPKPHPATRPRPTRHEQRPLETRVQLARTPLVPGPDAADPAPRR
eukprot:65245-Chlamydomonas_euryale.AAC.1